MAGRIDLTQVEGLIDLIEAETETQRKGAMRVAEVRPTVIQGLLGSWTELSGVVGQFSSQV
jgi:tRNA U34 5-carboxymethylaminomethyl modifying GTPase MnmE/TrmE